jgi:toxin ParE1/3/4
MDALETYAYLAREASVETAERFLDAVEVTCEWLAGMPGVGKPREFRSPLLRTLRSHSVRGFRSYLLFYIVEDDPARLVVVRILHAARDLESELGEWTP